MVIADVKRNLGRTVFFDGSQYILSAVILRKNDKNEFWHSAEIKDIKNQNSVAIVLLDKIST